MSALSIGNKWVIVDTCIISRVQDLPDTSGAQIFERVKETIGDFSPVITWLIRFEFLRKSETKSELEQFSNYIQERYKEIEIKNDDDEYDIVKLASECAVVCWRYKKSHARNISLPDYVHHGLLRRYPQSFFILTFDSNDFPSPVFEIVCQSSVKVGNGRETWVLKKINKDVFDKYYDEFKGTILWHGSRSQQ